jgi:puromycin-sensitive aminopeptidase
MGDKNFRLPTDIRPERYLFEITPNLSARTFAGKGTVELVLDRPTKSITVHGVHLSVQKATVAGATATSTIDEVSQTITLAFDRELPKGKASLAVEWTGVFHEDLRGLYMAGEVGVTQFEAADARRVFPCFDEPAFKATWELTMVGSKDLAIISNGAVTKEEELPGGLKRVHFAPTPKMSSYLVAMVIGKLSGSGTRTERNVPMRTWSVPEKAHLTNFGQECAGSVLPLLEDYFGTPYVFGKLDQIGIPDFEAGAMENSGCITYREVVLLVDPDKAPLPVLKRVAEVITHELAHQWFGNLVTMQWWDDLWLNEAFATWMAYKIVDQWKPQWRMWDDFENGKAAALALDAMESTHPIRYEVLNADQATENFDVITYEKGGAMLRMIEGYVGVEKFREGIRDYMKKHAFSNATMDDLWNAIARASGQPIGEVANSWVRQSGFPLVDVKTEGNKVTFSQRRFFADPKVFARSDDTLWPVPIVLRWADDRGQHESRMLLRERTGELTLPAQGPVKYVCANKGGAGFYRVKYEPAAISALARNGLDLPPVERMNLIADAWALFRAGAGPLETLLELLLAAGADTDYAVLGEAVSRLDLLDRRGVTDETRPAFQQFVTGLFQQQLATLGWDSKAGEADPRRLQRAAIVRALALTARSPDAVKEASSRYARVLRGDAAALDANLLDAASVTAARAGDPALFDELVQRVSTDTDPASKRRTLVALASFESPALQDKVINLFLTDTVPMQDATTYLGALISNRPAQAKAWEFIRANWSEVRKKTAAPMLTRRLVEALGELVQKRAEVEAFIDQQAESLSSSPAAIKQTRERMRLDEDVQQRATPALTAWLKSRGK